MFVTISRQFAAGGSEVATRVAQDLHWTVVDNAFVDEIARRSGYAAEDVAGLEERVPTFMERLAKTSALSFGDFLMSAPEAAGESEEHKLARITRDVVAELGRRDRVVLVGRAASAVLARESQAIHVRLVASKPFRIRRAMERLGLDEKQATRVLEDTDRNRFEYHRSYYDSDLRDPTNYHMVLNTERLGVEGAAQLVVARARALGW